MVPSEALLVVPVVPLLLCDYSNYYYSEVACY